MATVTQISRSNTMLNIFIWSDNDRMYNLLMGDCEGLDLTHYNIERYEPKHGSLDVYLKAIV